MSETAEEQSTAEENPITASEDNEVHEGPLIVRRKSVTLPYLQPKFESLTQGDEIREGSFVVDGKTLSKLILSQSLTTDMSLLLFILTGLKDCGKTDVLEHVFKESVNPPGEKKKLSKVGERNKKGLSFYEVAVAGDSQLTVTFDWSFFTRSSGYLHCFVSALLQYANKKMLCIQTEQPCSNDRFFDDSTLSDHFNTILEGLHSHFSKVECKNDDPKFLAGLSLVNVWDLESINIAVKLVLSMLVGQLKYSFVIFGHNLANHVRMPEVEECLELLRFAHLTKDHDAERGEVCIAAGLVTSTQTSDEEEEAELKSLLKVYVASNAKLLGVEKCVHENPQILDSKKPKEIKQFFEELVVAHKCKRSIPLSWILLRSAFFKSGVLYVEKKTLKDVASKLSMTEENFEQFLTDFTAMGSIIYNPMIPALKQNVILNPVDFCFRLNSLFEARFDGDLKKGIVPMSYLRRIFGSDADFFLHVLISSKHAINLDVKKIKYLAGESQPPFPEHLCYFLPIICKKILKTKKKASSLFLRVKSTFLPSNVGQILVEQLLLDASISLIPTKYSNIVSFEYKLKDALKSVNFSVISHTDACEISLELSYDSAPLVVKAVRSLVMDSCLSISRELKEKCIPFGTEVQDVGVLCATTGGFHSFPNEVQCQECQGPLSDWYPIYCELIQEAPLLQAFFDHHPKVTPEVVTKFAKELVQMCSSREERSKLMEGLGQQQENFTENTFALYITGALHICAARKDGNSFAFYTILHSLNSEYGKKFRRYLPSL